MPTPNENESKNKSSSVREGYEVTDVSVSGIIVFLVGLFVSIGVFFVFCFGMGKVINNALIKRDGPRNKWNATLQPNGGKIKNMESNPAGEQIQLQQLTHNFPTPRLQNDNGNQDLTDLHRREDLLLNHYSWVDQSHGVVRIPIDRAMELLAQRGLPVQQTSGPSGPLLFGDSKPTVQMPLTDGFARTGYEQEENTAPGQPGEQASAKANNN
ncbi:MAG TPA: hypothetical protein VFW25_14955 [Silvibacterium sp.]|nr:hypothetical protein [Silvibacterium sp.]